MFKRRNGSGVLESNSNRYSSHKRSFSKFFMVYMILLLLCAQIMLVYTSPFAGFAAAYQDIPPSVSNYYVTPTTGYNTTIFTYYATYSDGNGDWPSLIRVQIDGGNSYSMYRYNGTSAKTGLYYYYSTYLNPGTHNFTIVFNDGNGTSNYRTNTSWYPYVMNGTQVPATTLSDAKVSPSYGTTDTLFKFEVTYTNSYNYTPYWVQVYIDNVPYNMSHVGGSYDTGAIFVYSTKLGAGSHSYYFSTQTSGSSARLPQWSSYQGPNMLDFIFMDLSQGTVTPESGIPATYFNYTVVYRGGDFVPGGDGIDNDNDNSILSRDGKDNDNDWTGWNGSSWNNDTNHNGVADKDFDGVPFIDDDGDNRTDEETLNGKDDDADGLVDEDCSGGDANGDMDSTYDPEPNVDEKNEGVDEEIYNGIDDDGDGNIDEDLRDYHINGSGAPPAVAWVYIDDQAFTMSHSPGNYSNGVTFWYNTTLGKGVHNYFFYFKYRNKTAYLPVFNKTAHGYFPGPSVYSEGASLQNGKVTPDAGYPNTVFNFTVTYRHSNNTAPDNSWVYIDDTAYILNSQSSNYASGVTFWYKTALSLGQHYFYFKFTLGNKTFYYPASGNLTGPAVNSSMDQLTTTSLSPTQGNITTSFTYKLSYYKLPYSEPISDVKVVIDKVAHNMTKLSSNNTYNFEYKTTLAVGDHHYYFKFKAGVLQYTVPSSGNYTGPKVIDAPPKLSAGMVSPAVGYENTTTFDFTVYYSDLEGKAPTTRQVWLNGGYHDMAYVSGSYKTNAKFSFNTTLLEGNYQFHFKFSDGVTEVRFPQTGNMDGPAVSKQGGPLNYPPELYNGSVSPAKAPLDSEIIYTVYYRDKNGDAPGVSNVVIDDVYYNMTGGGGDFWHGKEYTYTTNNLALGDHDFYFHFKDINNSAGRLPAIGYYNGPQIVPPQNKPPDLSNGTVTPQAGNTSVEYTFSIVYSDHENDKPELTTVYIDNYPYTMVSGNSSNYRAGVLFKYKTRLGPGNHSYYFLFNDSHNSSRYPDSGALSGPRVSKAPGWNNTAPRLTYGRVYPQSGTPSTNFTYYCYYYDADGDRPVLHHVNIDGNLYEMTGYSSQNYQTTAYWYYSFSITKLSEGNHTYYFIFSDGYEQVRLPASGTYTGPAVSTVPSNTKPVLSNGKVTPAKGDTTKEFVFTVSYFDADGGSPTITLIYIDGRPYVMTMTASQISSSGAHLAFEYRTKLGVGAHYYYFIFSDGTATVRLPVTASYIGPVVERVNAAPVADAGSDQVHTTGPPKTVFFDGSGSHDPDNDWLTYFWDFGDGGYAFGVKTSHIFHGVGVYNVTLTVSDGRLKDTDNCSIKITDSGQGKSKGKAPDKNPRLDSGFYYTALGASVSAGVLVAGVAVASTEWGLYALLSLFLPLYVRLRKEQVLDNFIRGKIYGYIIANPGDHYNSIRTALKLKNGALAYHLQTLEREQLVKSQTDGKFKRFYPFEMRVPPRSTKLTTMRQNIVEKIKSEPGITQNDISGKLGVSHQAISYHLRTLVQLGAVRVERNGRANYCYPGTNDSILQYPDEDEQEWT